MMMRQWVVYERPKDYPDKYVVRGVTIRPGQLSPDRDPTFVGNTLDEARAAIMALPGAHNLIRLARFAEDEPQIVEVWL